MKMPTKLLSWTTVVGLILSASLASVPAYAAKDDEPSAGEMVVDVAIARPVGLLVTTAGAAAFLVSLPFSALGGNVSEAAEMLVIKPGKETFVRCLGCRTSGRYQSLNSND